MADQIADVHHCPRAAGLLSVSHAQQIGEIKSGPRACRPRLGTGPNGCAECRLVSAGAF